MKDDNDGHVLKKDKDGVRACSNRKYIDICIGESQFHLELNTIDQNYEGKHTTLDSNAVLLRPKQHQTSSSNLNHDQQNDTRLLSFDLIQ